MDPVDEFLAALDPESRAVFERICALVREVVPDVAQGVSYGVPALFHGGRPLIGFHAGRNFLSVYPYSGDVVGALRERLAGLETTRGSVHFSAAEPLSDEAVRALVELRVAEIEGRA
jgi:uncharacterized protein YdhG (YjbR/CyaY superfamily)